MPHPSAVHVDAALSTMLASHSPGDFHADELLPIVETDKLSGKFARYSRANVTRVDYDLMGPKSRANEVDYAVEFGSYSCDMRGLSASVNFAAEMNADAPQDVREAAVKRIMNGLLLQREIRTATLLQTAGNYAAANTAAVSGGAWSDVSLGKPLIDIHNARAAIAPGGAEDTELVLTLALDLWLALSRHPDLRGGGTLSPVATLEEAAQRLGVSRILVSEVMKNTAKDGQTPVYARVWDRTKAVLTRVPKGDWIDRSGFGCTFRWLDAGMPLKVRSNVEPLKGFGGSEDFVVELADDEVVVQSDMGFLITGCL